MNVKIMGGITPKPETIRIADVPKELQSTAAKQYIYNSINADKLESASMRTEVYDLINQIDMDKYVNLVFDKKDQIAMSILSIELYNLLYSRGFIFITQDQIMEALK